MTILGCPMCPWRAGVVGGPEAAEAIYELHVNHHCDAFALQLATVF